MELAVSSLVGLLFIILGGLFFIAPLLVKAAPSIENLPWIILYVYRREGFVFITSPLLVVISVLSFFFNSIIKR